jgi:hypothetical protein
MNRRTFVRTTALHDSAFSSASQLSRVVPQCCGLVWNEVRAQRRAGRNVAIYWDRASWGV